MQSKKSSQTGNTSSGDVFSTFLDTVRGGQPEDLESIFSVLRFLKVAGPQVLEKLLALFGTNSNNLMDNLLQAAENELIIIGDNPKFPNEPVASITPAGEAFLTSEKQRRDTSKT